MVFSSAWFIRHSSINLKFPDNNTSGTFKPLNSAGRVPGGEIWLTTGTYKFILATSNNVTIATYDNVFSVGGNNLVVNYTGTGAQTTFVLPFSPVINTQIYINGVYKNKNTYTLTTTSIIFSEAPPINSTIEVLYN